VERVRKKKKAEEELRLGAFAQEHQRGAKARLTKESTKPAARANGSERLGVKRGIKRVRRTGRKKRKKEREESRKPIKPYAKIIRKRLTTRGKQKKTRGYSRVRDRHGPGDLRIRT